MFCDCVPPHDSQDPSPGDCGFPRSLYGGLEVNFLLAHDLSPLPATRPSALIYSLPLHHGEGAGTRTWQVAPRGHEMLMENLFMALLAQDESWAFIDQARALGEVQHPR